MHIPKLFSVLVVFSFFVSFNPPARLVRTSEQFTIENPPSRNGLSTFQIPGLNSEFRIKPFIDLVASGMQVYPNPAIQGELLAVQVKVTNQGTISAGRFTVQWWSSRAVVGCTWIVLSLAPGASRNLDCTYTYRGWNNSYDIMEVVDPDDLVVEPRLANNSRTATLRVNPAP